MADACWLTLTLKARVDEADRRFQALVMDFQRLSRSAINSARC
jgi:hypothetical protein